MSWKQRKARRRDELPKSCPGCERQNNTGVTGHGGWHRYFGFEVPMVGCGGCGYIIPLKLEGEKTRERPPATRV